MSFVDVDVESRTSVREAISTLITEYNLMLANGGTIPFQSKRISYFILVHDGCL